ncbi:hypothetical protein RIF29_37734 [Crotalaria pallida]|uniref:Uncharacterized protein n=1 Tax=Crotalaria pallida TaxID=3830 RepID=A0AAN9ECV8_CROPI
MQFVLFFDLVLPQPPTKRILIFSEYCVYLTTEINRICLHSILIKYIKISHKERYVFGCSTKKGSAYGGANPIKSALNPSFLPSFLRSALVWLVWTPTPRKQKQKQKQKSFIVFS